MQNLNLPVFELFDDDSTLCGIEADIIQKFSEETIKKTILRSLCVDSRKIQKGDWFICLKGENFDGHDFIDAAIASGAAGIIYEKGEVHHPGIKVCDTTIFLGKIAALHRKIINPVVIAVTGSNGKTSVKELLSFLLEQTAPGQVCSSTGNFNNQFGVPYTLLSLEARHKFIVVEIGTNHPGEIAPLSVLAAPDYAIITSVSPGHIGNFGSLKSIIKEKSDIVSGMKPGAVLVVNADLSKDPTVQNKVAGRGISLVTPDDSISLVDHSDNGIEFSLEKEIYRYPVCGLHQFQNLRLACALLNELAKNSRAHIDTASLKNALAQLKNYRPIKGRLQKISTAMYNVWDDTYNANPASFAEAIKFIAQITDGSPTFGAFGMMGELGDFTIEAHEELGRLTVEYGFTSVFFSADDEKIRNAFLRGRRSASQASSQASVASQQLPPDEAPETMVAANTDQDIQYGFKYLLSKMKQGDHLLVKGSRSTRMERILKPFMTKG